MATPKRDIKIAELNPRMFDIAFTADGDFDVVENREEWIQSLKLRLVEQKGDWFFDTSMGLPWIEHPRYRGPIILGTRPATDFELIKLFVIREIKKDPRVQRVEGTQVFWEDESVRKIRITTWVFPIDEEPFQLNLVV
jgi:hypothetical protein